MKVSYFGDFGYFWRPRCHLLILLCFGSHSLSTPEAILLMASVLVSGPWMPVYAGFDYVLRCEVHVLFVIW